MGRGKRRASSRSNLFDLPEDISIQILVKLPAKSLLRFRSICKSMCSLISHPSFIDAHLKHQTSSSNNNSYLLLRYKPDIQYKKSKARSSIHHDDESFGQYFQPELPEQFKPSDIYGTCNGIVCLSESPLIPSSDIYLWNPALRRMKTLPKPHKVDLLGTAFVAFGLDCRGNDYMVVKIVCFPPSINNPYNTSFRLDVYSLSTNSWRKIGVAALSYSILGCQLAINNGAAYWTAHVETKDAEGWSIFQIEMGDKVCSEVMLPDRAHRGCPSMAVWGESLYLYDFLWSEVWECSIWRMECSKLGTWTKRLTIKFPQLCPSRIGFRRNRELLLLDYMGRLVSYSPENQQVKALGIIAVLISSLHSYVESLILLGDKDSYSI